VALFIQNLLGAAMEVLGKLDEPARQKWSLYPKGTRLQLWLYPEAAPLRLVKDRGTWHRTRREADFIDYRMTFKSLSHAWPVLLGRRSVAEAYRRHHLEIEGDIMTILPMMNSINLVEDYLFPRFWVAPILEDHLRRNAGKGRFYLHLLYHCIRGVSRDT